MDALNVPRALRLTATLLELHEENTFKVRAWQNAEAALERAGDADTVLQGQPTPEELMTRIEGLSKGMAVAISEALRTGTLAELERLLSITPPGVVKMMQIKGIGPKRVRQLWREAAIETPEALQEACEAGVVAKIKGFGPKIQEQIREAIEFTIAARGQVLLSQADALAEELLGILRALPAVGRVEIAGATRRALETVSEVVLVAGVEEGGFANVLDALDGAPGLVSNPRRSGPRVWRGTAPDYAAVPVEVVLTTPDCFLNEWFLATGSEAHLDAQLPPQALEWLAPATQQAAAKPQPTTLRHVVRSAKFQTETALYAAAGLKQCIEPELREGRNELLLAAEEKLPRLITNADLRGALHNHSTYSDGIHTLRRMAEHLRDAGYEYLGICDHSRSAGYAGGLPDHKVREQWREIDALNTELAPFRIFKGIESDILADGSLDYDDELLAGFDFVVASVHSGLRMDEAKATARLLRAIENPFTTMLGHPTGRLLLRREGYPLDFKAVIDACAHYGVAIELNSNPWRLDLDWRWLSYALEQGVLTALNPDAHSVSGYADMAYGVRLGRKAHLTAEKALNTWPQAQLAAWFEDHKARRG
jgi:DNA polymerase (family X)